MTGESSRCHRIRSVRWNGEQDQSVELSPYHLAIAPHLCVKIRRYANDVGVYRIKKFSVCLRDMRYYSFYSYISEVYNPETSSILTKWVKSNKELIDLSLRIRFLSKCKRSNIVPKHFNISRLTELTFYFDDSKRRWNKYTNMFTNRLFNLEIRDNTRKRHHIISTIYRYTRKIEERLPYYICKKNSFIHKNFLLTNIIFVKETDFLINLIGWFINRIFITQNKIKI